MRAYLVHFPVSAPKEDQDGRHALYNLFVNHPFPNCAALTLFEGGGISRARPFIQVMYVTAISGSSGRIGVVKTDWLS